MQLFIRGYSTAVLDAKPSDTVAFIKAQLADSANCTPAELSLCAGGSPLSDDLLVSELASVELDLNVELVGGKVHGSLARAGKVKGQTPKVEKQQKKKKKTGRAKRRIQYNRRFVNFVQQVGRRRGPNANS